MRRLAPAAAMLALALYGCGGSSGEESRRSATYHGVTFTLTGKQLMAELDEQDADARALVRIARGRRATGWCASRSGYASEGAGRFADDGTTATATLDRDVSSDVERCGVRVAGVPGASPASRFHVAPGAKPTAIAGEEPDVEQVRALVPRELRVERILLFGYRAAVIVRSGRGGPLRQLDAEKVNGAWRLRR